MPKNLENKKTLVLLDVHAIIHRAYHALPEFATSKGEPTQEYRSEYISVSARFTFKLTDEIPLFKISVGHVISRDF